MTHPKDRLPLRRGAIAAVALSLGLVGNGMAQGFDFNRMVSGGGGGGGTDPAKRKIVSERGRYICLDVKPGPGNQAVFTIWSMIPEPKNRLNKIEFDTGKRRPELISSLKVTFLPPGIKSQVTTSPGSGKRFQVLLPYEHFGPGKSRGGIGTGNVILISATLGPGQTYADLRNALHEGLDPAREAYGLRVSVAGHNFLGGPPPGVGSIQDDATFSLGGPAPQCQR